MRSSRLLCQRFVLGKIIATISNSNNPWLGRPRFLCCRNPLHGSRSIKQEIAASFRHWIVETRNPDAISVHEDVRRICRVLESPVEHLESALSQLNIKITEERVIKVLKCQEQLNNGVNGAISALRFFDWASQQLPYRHTSAAYHRFFTTIRKSGSTEILIRWLDSFQNRRSVSGSRFYECLIMGYALGGRPDVALQLFARMRFHGFDLQFQNGSYSALLNALVDENCIDVANVIHSQIARSRNSADFPDEFLFRIRALIKQERLEDAKLLFSDERLRKHGDVAAAVLVDGLCKCGRFDELEDVISMLRKKLGPSAMDKAYDAWILGLAQKGRSSTAFQLLENLVSQGLTPRASCYNTLLRVLLCNNKLGRAHKLMQQMRQRNICPDVTVMNALLSATVKSGLLPVALELFDGRMQMGFVPDENVVNQLIFALCKDRRLEDACRVSEECLNVGFSLERKTFSVLLNMLHRDDMVDKLQHLVDKGVKNLVCRSSPNSRNIVSALCIAAKVVADRYLLSQRMRRSSGNLKRSAYSSLIKAFCSLKMGELASNLLAEMQFQGKCPSRETFKMVIRTLCEVGCPQHVLQILDLHVSRHIPGAKVYNICIHGLCYANFPEIATQVYNKMEENGCSPTAKSRICLLHGYLRCKKVNEAVKFFEKTSTVRSPCIRMYSVMISGLCKAGRIDLALEFYDKMAKRKWLPKVYCIEDLFHTTCNAGMYSEVFQLFVDVIAKGRKSTTFMYNILLRSIFSLQRRNKAEILFYLLQGNEVDPFVDMLGMHFTDISHAWEQHSHIEVMEEMIQKHFVPNTVTYNILLTYLCKEGNMKAASGFFNRMLKKGYVPNMWTFDILLHGYCRADMVKAARECLEEMTKHGFSPTIWTYKFFVDVVKSE